LQSANFHLWNVGKLVPDYTAQHPIWQSSSYSSPWEPQMWPIFVPPRGYLVPDICKTFCKLTVNVWVATVGGRSSLDANSMDQRITQEIPHLLWNQRVHYHFQKNPPLSLPPYIFQNRFKILSCTPRSSQWCLPFKFPYQNFVCISHLPHTCHTFWPPNPIWFDHSSSVWWRVELYVLSLMDDWGQKVFRFIQVKENCFQGAGHN
jgi:hypothetical protein